MTQAPDSAFSEAPQRQRWPLAAVMIIDLVAIILVLLLVTTVIAVIFVALHTFQDRTALQPGTMTQEQMLQLLGTDGFFASLLAQNLIFLGIPIIRVRLLRHQQLSDIGFHAQGMVRLILIGCALGFVILVSNAGLGYFFSNVGIEQNQAAQYPLFQGDYLGQVLFFIGGALLAPLGEEVLFRGYIFNAIRLTFQARWGVPLAYLISAIAFMAAHTLSATQGLAGLLIPTFLMGLLLAWSVHRTGSLLPGIIAHAINNGLALIVLLTCVNTSGLSECLRQ